VHNRELPGIGDHALDHRVDRHAETPPRPGTSFSYQSCASIKSALAGHVKRTGCTTGNAAQARP
jgi:hypothetical protein